MIFEALQSELVGFDFHLLRSIIQKIPEFNLAIGKKKLIAEFEETKTLTAGMKESVHRFWHVSQGRPGISQFIHFMISDAHFLLFIEQLQG